jgi:hypothetical protein
VNFSTDGDRHKLELELRLVHLQEAMSHLGRKQQLREQKTVDPSTCPKRPRESPIDKPEPKSFIAGINAGLFQTYINPERRGNAPRVCLSRTARKD